MKSMLPMVKFSFLVPTRNRPDLVARFLQSIVDTTSDINGLEVVLCFDDDDIESQKITDDRLNIKMVVLKKGATMGELNRACFDASTGRYVMLLNDDVILRTKGWDDIISGVFVSFEDDIALIHVNDLLFREKLCTFPMLSRRACLEIGICPSEYKRYRIDDHIWDTYNMLAYLGHKRIVYLPDVVFEHDNYEHAKKPQAGHTFKSEENKVYVPNQEIIEKDAAIFDSKLAERKKNALILASLVEGSKTERVLASYNGMLSVVKDLGYRRPDFITTMGGAPAATIDPRRPPTVTVAVVTSDIYKEHAKKCLQLLKRYTPQFDLVILDNNNSKDFSHPREMNKMRGMVKTDYLVLLDDDVFVEEGWLQGLLDGMDEDTGIITPLHRDKDGNVSYAGVYLAGDGLGTHAHLLDVPAAPRPVQCVCSAALMIDMRKCRDIPFDTSYRKYFFDLDYGLKVWEAGYKVVCTPKSIVTHLGGATLSWFTEEASKLVKRDAAIFTGIWVASGRLAEIEKRQWSKYPFIKGICDMPVRINAFFKEAGKMDFAAFKSGYADLIGAIRPMRLFNGMTAHAVFECIHACKKRGDFEKMRFCEEEHNVLVQYKRSLKFMLFDVVKAFLLRIFTAIKSNRFSYGVVNGIYKSLKSVFDLYLRMPSQIRGITDKPVFKLFAMYEAVRKVAVSAPKGAAPPQVSVKDTPKGGALVLSSLPPDKMKTYLPGIEGEPTLLITAGQKDAFDGYKTIEFRDSSGNASDTIDVNNISPSLLAELKAREFDLVAVLYGEPLKWGDARFERLVALLGRRFTIFFPGNGRRDYANYDDPNRILYNKAYLGSMFSFIPRPKGKKVLDVGCSDGLVCDLLLNENPESVTGIDVMDSVGCNYKDERLRYFKMDASKLSFDDASFDLTFSIATLEHCIDPLVVLREMRRVTKSGGYCYVQA
ncbi:MAG: methyltransferase domain-containing protein, partial [Deltaproteobacteria bacterium]|nr:methyltransferase domain-containing protein [Deltaproteobacteria bacterium]